MEEEKKYIYNDKAERIKTDAPIINTVFPYTVAFTRF